MDINPALLDCVAFICEERNVETVPGGTAFLVEVSDDTGDASIAWSYLVTALHELESIEGRWVIVRLNLSTPQKGGNEFEDIVTSKDDWFTHEAADVAIILSPACARHAVQRVPLSLFITPDFKLATTDFDGARGHLELLLKGAFPDGIPVQLGHQVFSTGLFVQSAGEKRNLPIIRFGNIVRMPGEELHSIEYPDKRKQLIRGYLTEVHSWGGHSGSPVFWHWEYNISRLIEAKIYNEPPVQPRSEILVIPQARRSQPETQPLPVLFSRGWIQGLLGLVSAHYDIPTKGTSKESVDNVITKLNSGIAIVTPAESIRELLMRDDVMQERDKRRKTIRAARPSATADIARPDASEQFTLAPNPKDRIKIPILTRGKFFEDLTKATRKRNKK